MERRLDEATLVGYMERLSNWGRWGPDDQAGTLNHITPERVARAAATVKSGTAVGCARPIGTGPKGMARKYLHFMTGSGEAAPHDGAATAGDWFGIGCHGYEFTHLDAHSHFIWKGEMYNGRPGSECSVAEGCLSGGIEPWFDGVSGRGVLIDGPTVLGRAFMEPSEALFPEDLDRFLAETGTTVEPGDLLFVRTGRDAYEAAGHPEATPVTSPGLDGTCLEWLADHQVSVIAGDGANDAMPATGVPSIGRVGPIHLVGLVHMGLWLIDNAELGPLSRECRRQGRFSFFVTIAPPPLRRVTGSPVNPVAIF